MANYVLPDLSYDYGALEPYISGKIMELHHDKHHAAYVKGANEAIERLAEARDKDDFTKMASLEKSLAFNLSGHVLHSVFWNNLMPKGGDRPRGELAAAIDNDLGGFEKFKKQMIAAATTLMGSGWSALTWDPLGQRLLTVQIYDHQSNVNQGGAPILVLDGWEHAFYLQYQNRKGEFFDAVWNVWNWDDAAERFAAARQVKVELSKTGAGAGAKK
jgi:Fe-Mn family superoxide dismutase